jgi:hypothetical protein
MPDRTECALCCRPLRPLITYEYERCWTNPVRMLRLSSSADWESLQKHGEAHLSYTMNLSGLSVLAHTS